MTTLKTRRMNTTQPLAKMEEKKFGKTEAARKKKLLEGYIEKHRHSWRKYPEPEIKREGKKEEEEEKEKERRRRERGIRRKHPAPPQNWKKKLPTTNQTLHLPPTFYLIPLPN